MDFAELTKGPMPPLRKRGAGISVSHGAGVDLARSAGFRMFSTAHLMMQELRAHVMLKMIRQAHEAELAEPGDPPTSSIVGVPEW